jgi:hypothetical protein
MRKLFVVALLVIGLVFSGNAFAKDCPPGQEKKGWKCVDIEEPDDGGVVINNNNDNDNSNFNLNTNTNRNTNENTNVQGQLQGQAQGQFQGQTAHNEGVVQSVKIEEATVYNHISPQLGKTDAELMDTEGVSTINSFTSIFKYDDDAYITMAEAKKASSGIDDINVEKALLWEPAVQLKELRYSGISEGKFMGTLTLKAKDTTVTADQLIARACVEAMKAGATEASFTIANAKKIKSSKYGIDFGSAASVAVNSSGSAVIAPGATLGWSGAETDNSYVPEVFVEMFHNANAIVE